MSCRLDAASAPLQSGFRLFWQNVFADYPAWPIHRIEKCHGAGSLWAVLLRGRKTKKPARVAPCGLLNIESKYCEINRGGEEEDRTPDLRIANATLSQLSYPPDVS